MVARLNPVHKIGRNVGIVDKPESFLHGPISVDCTTSSKSVFSRWCYIQYLKGDLCCDYSPLCFVPPPKKGFCFFRSPQGRNVLKGASQRALQCIVNGVPVFWMFVMYRFVIGSCRCRLPVIFYCNFYYGCTGISIRVLLSRFLR